jgi:NAD(P)-dependent dehydrogenase (short-subunit alcohol dehydrogenase family)
MIVTGAFGALGAIVTRELVKAHCRLACVDQLTSANAPSDSADCIVLAGIDLTDSTATCKAMMNAAGRLGGIDGLVNIAGGFAWEKIDGGDIATWDRLYNLNVRTAFNAIRASLPYILSGGRIVNMGAAGAVKAAAGMGAYAASKAGIAKMTEALSEELKDKGITVNAVLPSIIDTPANRLTMPQGEFERWVRPEQIADLIMFLLSERASAITGALIPITGRV